MPLFVEPTPHATPLHQIALAFLAGVLAGAHRLAQLARLRLLPSAVAAKKATL